MWKRRRRSVSRKVGLFADFSIGHPLCFTKSARENRRHSADKPIGRGGCRSQSPPLGACLRKSVSDPVSGQSDLLAGRRPSLRQRGVVARAAGQSSGDWPAPMESLVRAARSALAQAEGSVAQERGAVADPKAMIEDTQSDPAELIEIVFPQVTRELASAGDPRHSVVSREQDRPDCRYWAGFFAVSWCSSLSSVTAASTSISPDPSAHRALTAS